MKRVTISTRDGRVVHINPDYIVFFEAHGSGTVIELVNRTVQAMEKPAEVWRRIRQATNGVQASCEVSA